MALYLRDLPGTTLADLADEFNTDTRTWGGTTNEIAVRQEGDSAIIQLGDSVELPATSDGMEQLATFIDFPRAFLNRLDPDLRASWMTELLRRQTSNVTVRHTDGGVHEVYKPGQVRLEPAQILDKAMAVMTPQAEVAEWSISSDELAINVMVPENFDRGIGGDPQVDDITRGGLRLYQNRKLNHAPQVNTFLYRLICTNGMVVPETGLTIDARGQSVEQVLAELEMAAQRAFSQVEEQIEHFYSMREQRIEGDVTQAVIRVAQERGLPDRTAMALSRRVPELMDPEFLGHAPSMFDITNLITNQANHPDLRRRPGPRRVLEQAGGALVRQVQDRCNTCHQSLN